MRKWSTLAAGLMIVATTAIATVLLLGVTPMASDDVDKAGAWDQELRLRDAQEGFVGEAGKIWVIKPSGDWRLVPFVQDRELPPEETGRLSAEDLKSLIRSLRVHGFDHLPATIAPEDALSVNNRLLTLTYAGKTVTLTTAPASAAGMRGTETSEDEQRLLSIVESVRRLTTGD